VTVAPMVAQAMAVLTAVPETAARTVVPVTVGPTAARRP